MANETLHRVLLSIHLLGVFIMLMGIGLLVTTMLGLRKARTAEQLRQSLFAGRLVKKFMPVGVVIVLFAGIWLAFLKDPDYNWHSAWIITAFVLVVAFTVNGTLNIGKKMERLAAEAFKSSGDQLSPKLVEMSNNPSLHYTSWAGIGIIFSFIVLMVNKPGWLGSVLWVLAGIIVGLAINWLVAKPVSSVKKIGAKRPRQQRTAH